VLFVLISITVCRINSFARLNKFNFLDSTNKIQHRTFNPCILPNDLSTFISTSASENVSHIHILSNFDDKTNGTIYKSFTEFRKYYRKLNLLDQIVNPFTH
jgi:hypothetical protein